MKKSLLLCSALLAFPPATMAEEGRAHIPHKKIPDGTPPLPRPPKPVWTIPAEDILSEKTFLEGDRTITVREIPPIALPAPSQPAAPVEMTEELRERIQQYREKHPRRQTLSLGATVYKLEDGGVRTHLRVWGNGEGETSTFLSTRDFSHLSGVGEFTDKDGETRSLFLIWGIFDIPRLTRLHAAHNRPYTPPEIPDLPEGGAAFVITGGQPDDETLAAIRALHEILDHDAEKLKTAYENRTRAHREREEFLKNNPPEPKDIIIHHWKIVREEEGGAR